MRLQSVGLMAAAILLLFVMAPRAEAVILASDDFSGPGSGTGWEAGNDWEGLGGGMVSTADVASFRDFAAPIDGTNQVTYIRFDFTQSVPGTGAQWGGASLFEGTEGAEATETFFAGDPGQMPNQYGLDLHNDTQNGPPAGNGDALFSGIAINNQTHTIIAAIDTTPAGASTTYRMWVDSFVIGAPTATTTVNGPIDAPWGTFRMNSDATNTDFFDNLTIATTTREVGLVPEPSLLGMIGFFGAAMVGMNRRRR